MRYPLTWPPIPAQSLSLVEKVSSKLAVAIVAVISPDKQPSVVLLILHKYIGSVVFNFEAGCKKVYPFVWQPQDTLVTGFSKVVIRGVVKIISWIGGYFVVNRAGANRSMWRL